MLQGATYSAVFPCGDNPGHVCPVPVIIHRIIVAIDEINPADDLESRSDPPSQCRMEVVDPGIDDPDQHAVSSHAKRSPGFRCSDLYLALQKVRGDRPFW